MTFDSDVHYDSMTGLYRYEVMHRFLSTPEWNISHRRFECVMLSECVSGSASTREEASDAVQRWIADRTTRHVQEDTK